MTANGWLSAVGNVEFPTIDTSVFLPYATSTYSSGSTLSNMVIPANTNKKYNGYHIPNVRDQALSLTIFLHRRCSQIITTPRSGLPVR